MQLVRITAPDPILTVAEAKKHLRVEHSDDDWLIDAYIQAVTDIIDGPHGYLGRALGPQTWDLILSDAEFGLGLVCGRPASTRLDIPLAPLVSVDAVEYRSSGGTLTAFTTFDAFAVNGASVGSIRPSFGQSWPTLGEAGDAFRVRFQCGYGVSNQDSPPVIVEAVPWAIKAGIILHVGDLYKNRETTVLGQTVEILPAAKELLRPFRVHLALA